MPCKESPKVSVIIPTYNRADLLRQAIRSVLLQTYDNFEIIIVDDGSTDNTSAVVGSFSDDRIRYFWQENQERSAARNNGIREARGEYLAFLDSDDVWLSDRLAIQTKLLECHSQSPLAHGKYLRIDENNALVSPMEAYHRSNDIEVRDYSQDLELGCCVGILTVLVRRSAFEAVGGFDQQLSLAEDWDMWLRISELGPFCAVHVPVSALRVHEDNSTNDVTGMLESNLKIVERTAVRRGSSLNKKNQILARINAYARHGFEAFSLGLPQGTELLSEAQKLAVEVNEPSMVYGILLNLTIGEGRYRRSERLRMCALLKNSAEIVAQYGGLKKSQELIKKFWVEWMHNCYVLHDCRDALWCARQSGQIFSDRGVRSIFVRSLWRVATNRDLRRVRFPVEDELEAISRPSKYEQN